MFGIIERGGKEMKVEEDEEMLVEKLDVKEGDSFRFDK
ncbi:bL21 family ribosomal protein, partial [Staphylococcus aureus]